MRALGRILTFTRSLTPSYLVIVAASVFTSAAALATPFITGALTNTIVENMRTGAPVSDSVHAVVLGMLAYLGIGLASIAATAIGGLVGDVMSERMRAMLSTRYFDHLLRLPQSYFDEELTGTVVSRLDRSIVTITEFAKVFANQFLSTLITTGAILVILAVYAWPIAVLLALVVPVYIWLTSLTSRRWQRLENRKNEQVDLARGRFAEVIGQIRVVASFVQGPREANRFDERFTSVVTTSVSQSRHWHGMDALRNVVLTTVFATMLGIVFVMTAQGNLSLGDLVVLVQLLAMAVTPVMMMSWFIDASQRAVSGSRDYFEVMSLPPDPALERADDASDEPLEPVPGAPAIEFSGVTFHYEGGADAVRDVSFTVGVGERVALVSESGGGKSTLISLLLGLYEPTEGEILLFGRPIETLSRATLRRAIGVVFQEPQLFSGTVAENIGYAESEPDLERIAVAAARANVTEFVERLPDGFDTIIGERGLKLSGGQRQRVAVARAAFKDAPVLVLDEATSALDTRSERLVQEGLDELMVGRSSLIVAHRLSTIASVDRIVTLRDGTVDEIGAPAALAVSGGLYEELLTLQRSGTKADRKRLKDHGLRL